MHVMISDHRNKIATMMGRIERHFVFIFRHITIRKIFNVLLCFFERKTRRSFLHSHPFYLRIEPCPFCNLHCKGCILGGGIKGIETNPEHRKQGVMKYDLFEESVRDFLPTLFKVNLYDEGEPLLNKEIYKMINLLSVNNVSSCISTNFSFNFSDDTLEQLLDCGLEHLVVSIDGAAQETYSSYRKGGDFNLVVSNIQRLLSIQNSRKKRSPLKVEIQFLDFDDNEEEREKMYQLAKQLDVWRLFIRRGCHRDGWKKFAGTEEERRKIGCYETYVSTTINSIGEMGTCDYGEDHGIPNIGLAKDYLSKGLRNHPSLVQLRKSFRDKSIPLNERCKDCHYC